MSKLFSDSPIISPTKAFLAQSSNLYNRDQKVQFNCECCGKQVIIPIRKFQKKEEKEIFLLCKVCGSEKTCLEKYSVKNGSYLEDVKKVISAKIKIAANKPEVREKYKQTCLKKYGATNFFSSDYGKSKVKETMKQKYGVEHALQLDTFKDKWRSTIINKYNDFSILHGSSKIEINNIKFDSSWEAAFFFFLKENNIIFEYQPAGILYSYNNEVHTYIPDFKVGEQLIEIKGDHFFENGTLINPYDRSKDGLAAAKFECMKQNNVKIMKYAEIKPYLEWFNSSIPVE